MLVTDLLREYSSNRFFILDSHQDAMKEQAIGHQHDDSDYIGYSYNIHHFNQLVEGAFFLYRRPGKLSSDKKFHIYGGGIIGSISKPDDEGNVVAAIKLGYQFETPISQGDFFLENYSWKTREKPGPGWKGFWINYGMNEIEPVDFWNLVEGRTCILKGNMLNKILSLEENEVVSDSIFDREFSISLEKNTAMKLEQKNTYSSIVAAKKVDFNHLNQLKKNLGTAGELLVLEYETDRLKRNGIDKVPEHVAVTIGDGLGYDIKSYDLDGNEIHIEVKTTKDNLIDGFYLSRRELEESKRTDYPYKIYRVYSFDEEKNTAAIKVYEGEISEEMFDMEPTSYLVKLK